VPLVIFLDQSYEFLDILNALFREMPFEVLTVDYYPLEAAFLGKILIVGND
jgi:hypothetical protein